MKERIKEGSVIIVEGRIYALFREKHPTTNEVCGKCEIRETCESGLEIHKLSDLCLANGVPGDCFFLECSQISAKKVEDIALEQNYSEADASSDEAPAKIKLFT